MKIEKGFWAILFIIPFFCNADWERTYHCLYAHWNQYGMAAFERENNEYLLIGQEMPYLFVVRTDYFGNTMYVRCITDIIPMSACATSDGGIIVVAHGIALAKLDSLDNLVWTRIHYGSAGYSWGFSVCETSDKGFAAVGQTGNDIFVVRTDSLGELVWSKEIGDPTTEEVGYSIIQTYDGGYAIAGVWNSAGCLIKLSGEGEVIYFRRFPSIVEARCIVQTSDSGFILVGRSGDGIAMRLDKSGGIVWVRSYGSPQVDGLMWISKTNDDCFIIAGFTELMSGYGPSNAYIGKIDNNGDTLWTRHFNPAGRLNIFNYVSETTDGGYIAAGVANIPPPDSTEAYLVKLDPMGVVEWERAMPITLTLSISPSPFNSSCVISAPAGSDVEIYDVNGRLVWGSPIYGVLGDNIQRGDLSPRSIVWTPDESVRNGVYLVRAKIGEQVMTKRVVLIR